MQGVSRTEAAIWKIIAHGTLPGDPHGLLVVWPRWEHLIHQVRPLVPIPGAPYGLLKFRLVTWHGAAVQLSDGTTIRPGTPVAEIHCHNPAILHLVKTSGISPFRACREDLRAMAGWLRDSGSRKNDVVALYGYTLLTVAAVRLGFEVRPHHASLITGLDRMFMTGLLMLYTRGGMGRLERGTTVGAYPKDVWMSRGELMRRYGLR